MLLALDTNASTAVTEELALEDIATAAVDGLDTVVVETTTGGTTVVRALSTVVFELHAPVIVIPEVMGAVTEHFRPSEGLQRRADVDKLANDVAAPPFTGAGVSDFSPSVFNGV